MHFLAFAAVLLAASGVAEATAQTPATERVVHLPEIALTIRTLRHAYPFRVEVARTEPEQARGLMFRKSVAAFGGMLFPYDPPQPASFWMKNTLAPLDMVFIRADGSIARIAAMTTPLSLDPVQAGEPIAAVLELKGGRAKALGITEASHVSWRGGPAG